VPSSPLTPDLRRHRLQRLLPGGRPRSLSRPSALRTFSRKPYSTRGPLRHRPALPGRVTKPQPNLAPGMKVPRLHRPDDSLSSASSPWSSAFVATSISHSSGRSFSSFRMAQRSYLGSRCPRRAERARFTSPSLPDAARRPAPSECRVHRASPDAAPDRRCPRHDPAARPACRDRRPPFASDSKPTYSTGPPTSSSTTPHVSTSSPRSLNRLPHRRQSLYRSHGRLLHRRRRCPHFTGKASLFEQRRVALSPVARFTMVPKAASPVAVIVRQPLVQIPPLCISVPRLMVPLLGRDRPPPRRVISSPTCPTRSARR
jgi:hypothetical protein